MIKFASYRILKYSVLKTSLNKCSVKYCQLAPIKAFHQSLCITSKISCNRQKYFSLTSNFSIKHLTGCIQSWKTWKSHGIPLFFSRPGKVMEIDSRFWKIHKKLWKLKGILLGNGIVPFFHPAFQYQDMFISSDQILVSSTSSCTVTGTL